MKVKELIEELKILDQNLTIKVQCSSDYMELVGELEEVSCFTPYNKEEKVVFLESFTDG